MFSALAFNYFVIVLFDFVVMGLVFSMIDELCFFAVMVIVISIVLNDVHV